MGDRAGDELRADIAQMMHDLDAFESEIRDLDAVTRMGRAADLYARLDRLQTQAIDQAVADTPVPDFPPADNRH